MRETTSSAALELFPSPVHVPPRSFTGHMYTHTCTDTHTHTHTHTQCIIADTCPAHLPTILAPLEASNKAYSFPSPGCAATTVSTLLLLAHNYLHSYIHVHTHTHTPPPAPVTRATRPSKRKAMAVLKTLCTAAICGTTEHQ